MQDLAGLLPLLVLGLLAYLLFIRPARNRAKAVQKLQNALSAGDEVMLTSGIFGTVEGIDGERIRVEISPAVSVVVHRGAIGKIVRDVAPGADELDAPADGSIEAGPADDVDTTDTPGSEPEGSVEPGADENPNTRGAN